MATPPGVTDASAHEEVTGFGGLYDLGGGGEMLASTATETEAETVADADGGDGDAGYVDVSVDAEGECVEDAAWGDAVAVAVTKDETYLAPTAGTEQTPERGQETYDNLGVDSQPMYDVPPLVPVRRYSLSGAPGGAVSEALRVVRSSSDAGATAGAVSDAALAAMRRASRQTAAGGSGYTYIDADASAGDNGGGQYAEVDPADEMYEAVGGGAGIGNVLHSTGAWQAVVGSSVETAVTAFPRQITVQGAAAPLDTTDGGGSGGGGAADMAGRTFVNTLYGTAGETATAGEGKGKGDGVPWTAGGGATWWRTSAILLAVLVVVVFGVGFGVLHWGAGRRAPGTPVVGQSVATQGASTAARVTTTSVTAPPIATTSSIATAATARTGTPLITTTTSTTTALVVPELPPFSVSLRVWHLSDAIDSMEHEYNTAMPRDCVYHTSVRCRSESVANAIVFNPPCAVLGLFSIREGCVPRGGTLGDVVAAVAANLEYVRNSFSVYSHAGTSGGYSSIVFAKLRAAQTISFVDLDSTAPTLAISFPAWEGPTFCGLRVDRAADARQPVTVMLPATVDTIYRDLVVTSSSVVTIDAPGLVVITGCLGTRAVNHNTIIKAPQLAAILGCIFLDYPPFNWAVDRVVYRDLSTNATAVIPAHVMFYPFTD